MKMLKAVTAGIIVLIFAGSVFAADRPTVVRTGKLTGKLMQKSGAPMSDGLVFFFNIVSGPPPLPEKYWRVPDEITELDAEGRFSAELIEGTYFVGAIKRAGGKEIGPPAEGDIFLVIRDAANKPKTFKAKAGEDQSIGTIGDALPYKKPASTAGTTGIEGIVVDPEGKPVVGVFVFAFFTPEMIGRPMFVSEKTGVDGKFLLRVASEGKYYLKVRDIYGGGPPRQGGIIGGYGDEGPKSVEVKNGAIAKGITIKITRFPGQGKPQQ